MTEDRKPKLLDQVRQAIQVITGYRCDPVDGDFDGNGVIDQLDYAAFSTCMSGPANTDLSAGCGVFDFNTSGGVDLQDAGTFQNRYNP